MKHCTIEGCDKPGVRRTWCHMHYQRWLRWEVSTDGYVKRPTYEGREARLRRGDQGQIVARQCTRCRKWLLPAAFYVDRKTPDDVSYDCQLCASERQTRHYDKMRTDEAGRQKVRLQQEAARARRKARLLPGGQRAYLKWLAGGAKRTMMPVEDVIDVFVELRARHATLAYAAGAIGYSERSLHEVLAGKRASTEAINVERACMYLGGEWMDRWRELDVPHGIDGWSKQHRYCQRCGTCWHAHAGRGFCAACLKADLVELHTGRVIRTHRERMADNLERTGRHTIRPRSGTRRLAHRVGSQ